MAELRWQKDPPGEPGDWLWVERKRDDRDFLGAGVCRVWKENGDEDYDWSFEEMRISFQGRPAPISWLFLEKMIDLFWAKIELPGEAGESRAAGVDYQI